MKSSPETERWRVFCAVELPAIQRELVAEHIAGLRDASRDVQITWNCADKLHITLKFIAGIESSRMPKLIRACENAAKETPVFQLALEGAGAFPPHGSPRVLWLGISDPSKSLLKLQSRLEDACGNEGITRDERPYKPHLTIARIRSPKGARSLAARHAEKGLEPSTFEVLEVVLIRSILATGGSRYSVLSRHGLDRGEESQLVVELD
jgi:2'-5' RNA ligase